MTHKQLNICCGLLLTACLVLTLYGTLAAQTPGTVTTTGKLVAVAGVVNCEGVPAVAPAVGVDVVCKVGTVTVMTGNLVPPIGNVAGIQFQVNSGTGDAITAILKRVLATDPISWDVVANGTRRLGSF